MPRTLFVLAGLALAACSAPVETPTVDDQPPDFDSELALVEAEDLNPDPGVVEVALEARVATLEVLPGTTTDVWTYNGGLPGPLIHAKVGDTLQVHFQNSLPEETTIHWHGMRVPVEMDGVPEISQTVVPPGGTFDYSFTVPDAGLYWYHPHHHSAAQVGYGLYGAILVDEPTEPPPGDPLVLVLSDMGVTEDGSLSPTTAGGEVGTLFGREGDVLLVNGKQRPTLHARSGKLQRWRLVNTAKSRYFQLAMEGHSFRRIGTDGGLSEYGVDLERIVLAPAERLDVLVVPTGTAGKPLDVRWVPFDRGYGSTEYRPEETLFTIDFAEEPASVVESPPPTSNTVPPLDLTGATLVDLELTQEFDENGKLILGINGLPTDLAEPLHGTVGETQIWTVSTQMEWSHPFHLHGFFFQVLGDDGLPQHPLEWKDTVDVPFHGQTRLAVKYEGRAGMWMFHCHILDHAEAGMMGHLHLME